MGVIDLLLTVVASYLIGSIPTAYLFGKWLKGIDIREHGSGNVGATNAFRVLGKGPGTIVLIIDIVKGVVPVLLAGVFHAQVPGRILAAIMAVCGHNWTCFLNFRRCSMGSGDWDLLRGYSSENYCNFLLHRLKT